MTQPSAVIDRLQPHWQIAGVGALMSTRLGGVSIGAFQGLNLRDSLGDAPDAVAENQRRFEAAIAAQATSGTPARPVYLRQVHGTRVLRLSRAKNPPKSGPNAAQLTATLMRSPTMVT